MDTYQANIDALRSKQEAALAHYRETGNESYKKKAMEYALAKVKLRALALKQHGVKKITIR